MQHKFDMIINAMSKIVLQVLIWSNLALRALCCSQFTFDHLLQLKLALRAYSFYPHFSVPTPLASDIMG